MSQEKPSPEEEQKIISAPWFIWTVVILQSILLAGFVLAVFQGKLEGGWEVAFNLFMSNFPVLALLWVAIKDVKLVSRIDNKGISYRWHPFRQEFRIFLWTDIHSVNYVKYGFLGYGWRFSLKYGEINNVSGRYGIAITTKNGSNYLLGTRRSKENSDELVRSARNDSGL